MIFISREWFCVLETLKNYIMKKSLLLLLISIPIVNVHATRIDRVNDIFYSYDSESGQCSLVSTDNHIILKEIIIPDSVYYDHSWYNLTSIGERAFEYCEDLTSITIPDNVTSIGSSAFTGCINLSSIVVSDGNNIILPKIRPVVGLLS